jgi:hypothetical protein
MAKKEKKSSSLTKAKKIEWLQPISPLVELTREY